MGFVCGVPLWTQHKINVSSSVGYSWALYVELRYGGFEMHEIGQDARGSSARILQYVKFGRWPIAAARNSSSHKLATVWE